jgi:hypothetical protein
MKDPHNSLYLECIQCRVFVLTQLSDASRLSRLGSGLGTGGRTGGSLMVDGAAASARARPPSVLCCDPMRRTISKNA